VRLLDDGQKQAASGDEAASYAVFYFHTLETARHVIEHESEAMSDLFVFDLEQHAAIIMSGEVGIIVGRAQYTQGENSYLLRYKAADGRAVEAWWPESALMDVLS
jgi:hypothetical protein